MLRSSARSTPWALFSVLFEEIVGIHYVIQRDLDVLHMYIYKSVISIFYFSFHYLLISESNHSKASASFRLRIGLQTVFFLINIFDFIRVSKLKIFFRNLQKTLCVFYAYTTLIKKSFFRVKKMFVKQRIDFFAAKMDYFWDKISLLRQKENSTIMRQIEYFFYN